MKREELKKKYIGEKLLTILRIKLTEEVKDNFKRIVDEARYRVGDGDIKNINILLFKNKKYLAFVDFDDDGYRSGSWYVVDLYKWLDNGTTEEIKHINSVVRNIDFYERNRRGYLMIQTDEYIIEMGQDNSDSYYPSNFFNVKDLKKAIKEGRMKGGQIQNLVSEEEAIEREI